MSSSDFRSNRDQDVQRMLFKDRRSHGAGPLEDWRSWFPEIIGRSLPMQRVLETVAKVARSESSVLIFGESGTGKELIAAALHRLSTRSDKPFVALNCSAIPENLLESELFGHEKGSFTGADRRRAGRFELANGGTIFLDEIGDMPLNLQSKLLRVLQDKKFTPIGGNESREADVRIVAATHVDLDAAVKKGTFRLDLYYRLNVLPVHLPSLRERSEDIPSLLDHFIAIANRAHPVDQPCFLTTDAVSVLSAYAWPGNVRQLQNLVERLVVMRGGGAISTEHLPREFAEVIARIAAGEQLSAPIPNLEEQAIQAGPDVLLPTRHPGLGLAPTSLPNGPVLSPRPGQSSAQIPATFGELPAEGLDMISYIEQLENNLIMQALERTNYNKNQAAKLLGLNRTTLVERIKKRRILPLNLPSKEL